MQVAVKDSFEFFEVPTSADVMTSDQHYKDAMGVNTLSDVWPCMQLFDP